MLKETLINIGGTVAKRVEEHSPEICLGVGIASMVAATVFACKETIKAKKVVEDAKDDMETIAKTEETGTTYDDNNNPIEYTHEDSIKDRAIVCVRTSVELAKAYGPAIILTTVGIISLLKGHDILKKRNLALIAAYKSISEAYKKYQNRVKELIGETAAKELKYNVKTEDTIVETGKKNKDGTPKTKKEKKYIINNDALDFSPYARFYDEGCKSWTNDPEYNLTWLRSVQKWCNDRLQLERTLTLNDIYDELGIPRTKAGQVVGWSLDNPKSDGYIDFGIYNMAYTPNRDFVNGYEPVILLDFNVDGSIWDYIPDDEGVKTNGSVQA